MSDSITAPERYVIGTLIDDCGKVGIIYREIQAGTWSEQPLFNWRINYEIFYPSDGTISIIGKGTLDRLLVSGRLKILEVPDESK